MKETKWYRKIIFIIFFILNLYVTKANDLISIKYNDREEYLRIYFELTEKPIYFVKQIENTIELILPNTNLLLKNNDFDKKYSVLNKISINNLDKNLKIILKIDEKSVLKRYLYIDKKDNNNYKVVIDLDKNQTQDKKDLDDLDTFISKMNLDNTPVNLDNLIYDNVTLEYKNIDELLTLNNIITEQDIKDLEAQNNDNANLDTLIQELYKNEKQEKIVKKDNYSNLDDFLNKINLDENKNKKIDKNQNIKSKKEFVVVLDPGHGGYDPGTIGRYTNVKEKIINLAFAKEIKKELEKNNIKVFLTRNDDSFVSLIKRVIFTVNHKADLFISIHSDSNHNNNLRGSSIYTLGEENFNSTTMKILKKNVGYFQFLTNGYSIINEAKNKNIYQSDRLSNIILNNFNNFNIKTIYNPKKHANFTVLISHKYPTLLLELGFLSNYNDELLLMSVNYRKKISESITKSVIEFFKISGI